MKTSLWYFPYNRLELFYVPADRGEIAHDRYVVTFPECLIKVKCDEEKNRIKG